MFPEYSVLQNSGHRIKIKQKLGLSSKSALNLLKTWFLREKPAKNGFLLDLLPCQKLHKTQFK
jgi:hypothetical protein